MACLIVKLACKYFLQSPQSLFLCEFDSFARDTESLTNIADSPDQHLCAVLTSPMCSSHRLRFCYTAVVVHAHARQQTAHSLNGLHLNSGLVLVLPQRGGTHISVPTSSGESPSAGWVIFWQRGYAVLAAWVCCLPSQ